MEANILAVKDDMVLADTTIGHFWGKLCISDIIWLGAGFFELDCKDVLDAQSICRSKSDSYSITQKGKEIILRGRVEAVEDGVLFLRLHTDLVMLEISRRFDFTQYLNNFVRISLSEIDLYPVIY